jgi:hypothetical protein
MPKAAPSAFFYRLKLAVPVISAAGMLFLVLTLVTGPADVNPVGGPELAADVSVKPGVEQVRPVSQAFRNSGLRGLRLEQAMLESLTVAVSARSNGDIFRHFGRQQRQGFGALSPGPLMHNVGQRAGNGRHYVLPNVPSTHRLTKDAAY